MKLHVFANTQELGQAAAAHIARLSAQAVAARGRFVVALSGGSLPKIIGPALAAKPLRSQIDWAAWHIAWADERCVPPTHADSNYAQAKAYFFDLLPLPANQIYNPDTTLPPHQAATAYQSTLAHLFQLPITPYPRFDLILLGLGEDGHTASLFPGHPLLNESQSWVAPIFDSPKPPPERITLTLPVINQARNLMFITAGSGKADALAQIFGDKASPLPARLVQPLQGELHWFVDTAAAAKIK